MNSTTGSPGTGPDRPEGLRKRKKRLLRQQLSQTAATMFMKRGFDAVRLSEVAEACGVSVKTVTNYFPTKESLILDRWDTTVAALRSRLAEPGVGPVAATLRLLGDELSGLTAWLAAQDDQVAASATLQRVGELIRDTPALRAHQHDTMNRLTTVAAETLAKQTGMSVDDPEPHTAAIALTGLWHSQFRALRKYLDGTRTPAEVHHLVTSEVARSAQLIDTGLNSLGVFVQPPPTTA